jgi:hypothetical protein
MRRHRELERSISISQGKAVKILYNSERFIPLKDRWVTLLCEITDYFLRQKPGSRQNLTNGHKLGNNDSNVQIFMTISMPMVALMEYTVCPWYIVRSVMTLTVVSMRALITGMSVVALILWCSVEDPDHFDRIRIWLFSLILLQIRTSLYESKKLSYIISVHH